MTPRFHPQLVNDCSGDPALYVDFLHERRALLFDLGELSPLPARKLLRVSHVFVSHAHVDHFIGFDQLIRLLLGRDKQLNLCGPPGFIDRIEHRLAGYTWNLVADYQTDFQLVATEFHPDDTLHSARFRCRTGFTREQDQRHQTHGGIVLDEESLRVRAVALDHGTISLAFALEEKLHVNIMKNRLSELGLATGPWLAELKKAIVADCDDSTPIRAGRVGEKGVRNEPYLLGDLRQQILTIVPGQKVAYVADAAPSPDNGARIIELARSADYLFCEAMFLDNDRQLAIDRRHLTARMAGELGRRAGVARLIPFHFSPRYHGQEELLRSEAQAAFAGESCARAPDTPSPS